MIIEINNEIPNMDQEEDKRIDVNNKELNLINKKTTFQIISKEQILNELTELSDTFSIQSRDLMGNLNFM